MVVKYVVIDVDMVVIFFFFVYLCRGLDFENGGDDLGLGGEFLILGGIEGRMLVVWNSIWNVGGY